MVPILIHSLFSEISKGTAIAIHHLLSVVVFAFLYWILDNYQSGSLSEFQQHFKHSEKKRLGLYDCFYFSLVTQTTIGYGDIVPLTNTAKFLVILQLLTIYGLLSLNFL